MASSEARSVGDVGIDTIFSDEAHRLAEHASGSRTRPRTEEEPKRMRCRRGGGAKSSFGARMDAKATVAALTPGPRVDLGVRVESPRGHRPASPSRCLPP